MFREKLNWLCPEFSHRVYEHDRDRLVFSSAINSEVPMEGDRQRFWDTARRSERNPEVPYIRFKIRSDDHSNYLFVAESFLRS
jgi:hypothetical protein